MSRSFLYQAFCRFLQLIRLCCRSDTDLAIDVIMLRHEVAVLRRHVQVVMDEDEHVEPSEESLRAVDRRTEAVQVHR